MKHPIEAWNHYLRTMNDLELKEPGHGYWRASNLGRCYRFQYWKRANEKDSEIIPIRVLRTFALGKVIHKNIQQALELEQCEQEFEFESIIFHPDYFDEHKVYDFKSILSWPFKKMDKPNYDIRKEHFDHILQVMVEAMYMNRKEGELIYLNKDSMLTNLDIGKPFIFNTEEWKPIVTEELNKLNDYWDRKELPPAFPRAFGGRECNPYCTYRTKCAMSELEGGKSA